MLSITSPAGVDAERRQRLTEVANGPAHPRLDGAKWLPELFRDLGLAESLRVEQENRTLDRRQLVERVRELGIADRTPRVHRWILLRFNVCDVVLTLGIRARRTPFYLRAPAAAAELVEREIVGDTVQPEPDRAACLIERVSLLSRAQEDLLQDLLRHVSIAGDPHDHGEDDPGVAIVQCPQCLRFASNERGDQRLIGHVFVR